ncbi:sigma 54-interacting transcriptional regulator [Clostridium sediminicola]|uniref:sigma-54 interaction domain-containing protein n=1 Tax=Clostridium sediminicola TaxID=3114879 RepID=UPI0031F1D9D4
MDNDLQNKKYLDHLDRDTLLRILENLHHEVYVTDKNGKVLYVNPACVRHYGLTPMEIVGKHTIDLYKGRWEPTCHPTLYREKKRIMVEHKFCMGGTGVSAVVPLLDKNDEIEMVVSSVEEKLHNYDISFKRYDNSTENHNEEDSKSNNLFIAESSSYKNILKIANKASQADISILLLGESGTGKTYLAKHIHENSIRKNHPLLSINCATIPENLMESELFGYVPHAFTGASPKGKIGLLELADNGTLFLDEIGEMSMALQAKLLTVLDDKTFYPIGAKSPKSVNIRIVAATNQNLEALIKEKRFRQDLYWRLSVVNLSLPPLRERKKDIIALSNYFLNSANEKYEFNKVFSQQVLDILCKYCWPGNIRQLKNVVERAVVLSNKNSIELEDFPPYILEKLIKNDPSNKKNYQYAIDNLEKRLIEDAFKEHKTTRKVAEALMMSQSKASRLKRKYNIEV